MGKYRKKRIFRPQKQYRIKKHNTGTFKIVTGVLAVGVLVFVGYSIAGPVSSYLAEKAKQAESDVRTPGQTNEITAPETTSAVEEAVTEAMTGEDTPVNSTADSGADVSAPAAGQDTDVQQTAPADTAPAQTEAAVPMKNDIRSGGAGYSVSSEDMRDRDRLCEALEAIRSDGASAVIMPMKTEGGYFNYATAIPFVKTVCDGDDPVLGTLTAKEAADLAKQYGLRPVALVNTLRDNNRYGDYRDGSYRSYDSDSTWLDAAPDNGGKPWLSPFDEVTQEYMCDIVKELGNAGFTEIVCDDFIFPEFRSTDIEILGEELEPYGDRYLALTKLARMMTSTGEEVGAEIILRITANSVIKGYSELFEPDELQGCTMTIDYSEYNISSTMVSAGEEVILDEMDMYDKITSVFTAVEHKADGLKTVPMIDRESMSADEYDNAIRAVTAMGYDRYYIY